MSKKRKKKDDHKQWSVRTKWNMHAHFPSFLWSASPQSSGGHLYIALMSILSVMIYSNGTSQCAEKFIPSSLRASSHPPLYLLDVCARLVSRICPVVKYFSEQMDPGGGRRWVKGGIGGASLALWERPRLGEIVPSLFLLLELQSQLGDRSPRDT